VNLNIPPVYGPTRQITPHVCEPLWMNITPCHTAIRQGWEGGTVCIGGRGDDMEPLWTMSFIS
jgi:hypothetical protein